MNLNGEQSLPGEGVALANVSVLDLTSSETGAICTQTLAWLGASVLKIHPPVGTGSVLNALPSAEDIHRSMLRADKLSVTLDLRRPEGLVLAQNLAEKADVVIEDWRPGEAEKHGIDYESVRISNPGAVYVSLRAAAPGSPRAAEPMLEGVAQALGGASAITGRGDREPLLAGYSFAGTTTGLTAALGVLAALHQRRRTGEGQKVTVGMQESVSNLVRGAFSQAASDAERPRLGNSFSHLVPFDIYPCAPGGPDDYVTIFIPPSQPVIGWKTLMTIIGNEEAIVDPRFATAPERAKHRAEVDEILTNWTRSRTKTEVMEAIGGGGGIAGAVLSTDDLLANDELWSRGSLMTATMPTGERMAMPGLPIRMSTSEPPEGRIPAIGADVDDVLIGWLGLDSSDIEKLREAGIV